MVIKCKFFFWRNHSVGDKDDVLLAVYCDLLTNKIWVATVVDITGFAPEESSIDDVVLVETKQVAVTHSKLLIVFLSLISNRFSNLFSNVLNHDVFRLQLLTSKEAISMNLADPNFDMFGVKL